MTQIHPLLAATLILPLLTACGGSSLLGGGKPPADPYVAEGQNLSMPPDLQLRAPSAGEVAPVNQTSADAIPDTGDLNGEPLDEPAPVRKKTAAIAPSQPQMDVYEKYGISKTKPDGTPKPQGDLQAELKAAQLAEKRRKNPNEGTIFNIGNIFKDG